MYGKMEICFYVDYYTHRTTLHKDISQREASSFTHRHTQAYKQKTERAEGEGLWRYAKIFYTKGSQ